MRNTPSRQAALTTAAGGLVIFIIFAVFADGAGACSYGTVATATFRGTINRIDKRTSTAIFDVERVESTAQPKADAETPRPPISMPFDNGEFDVRYSPEQLVELHEGVSYRVIASTPPGPDPDWYSTAVEHIATGDMCDYEDVPARTTLADGSAIVKPVKVPDRSNAATEPRARILAGLALLAVLAVAFFLWHRRRRTSPTSA